MHIIRNIGFTLVIVRVGVNSFLISILLKDRLQILLKNQNKLSELIPLYSLEIAVKFGMIPNLKSTITNFSFLW